MVALEKLIHLDETIVDVLERQAAFRGLSFEEYARYLLGEAARFIPQGWDMGGTSYSVPVAPLQNKPVATDTSETLAHFWDLLKSGARLSAMTGLLSCPECNTKLTANDVDNGKCGKCQAAIFHGSSP